VQFNCFLLQNYIFTQNGDFVHFYAILQPHYSKEFITLAIKTVFDVQFAAFCSKIAISD
jgi:hypothetical protein